MFKRRADYLMTVDVEVDYAQVDQFADEQSVERDDARIVFLDSVMRHIEDAGRNAVREAGQKLKQVEPDLEFMTVDVHFSGDSEGAVAALERWTDAVANLMATKRILRAWLRGSDGTDLTYWDEEYRAELEQSAESLDEETRAFIERLPDRD
jgi:hypothetical protein